ncbi:MAG TPA: YqzL family protein [Methylomusa anaerophila]|uniref:YqzL-like protein n=1 Tax=Methylomusa anaerophila TaxID=1930071 RepID=A0A348AP00_9FIRM|nr:YqzL family protein [Methylomusa anaerophila]BBB92798.1 hypothetical protein MAMMFC1_03499 [Methylomusa anaerophila]HML87351.1 YqzL family protein [Methylomusa anaerophila]
MIGLVLREMMWEIFQNTGNIDAYLAYRACVDNNASQPESRDLTGSLSAKLKIMSS